MLSERALEAAPLDDLAGRYEAATGETEPHVLWVQIARGGGVRAVSVVGEPARARSWSA